MGNQSNSLQEMFKGGASGRNDLMQYVNLLEPESIAHLSTPTPEVQQAMEANLNALLGGLPSQHFDITVTTSREMLGKMMASAMMNGYFLHAAQQRMTMEKAMASAIVPSQDSSSQDSLNPDSPNPDSPSEDDEQ
ncbi:MAG: DUF760 domain-containing protein [Elainellaceae cyanobacterium]